MKIPPNFRLIAVLASLLIFCGPAQASPFANPSEPSGIIIMDTPRPAQQIFPVRLVKIDGVEIPPRKQGVWLRPGTHRLRLVAERIDTDWTGGLRARQRQVANWPQKSRELLVEVQAGKKYYVGYDSSDADPKNWGPVVWQVK